MAEPNDVSPVKRILWWYYRSFGCVVCMVQFWSDRLFSGSLEEGVQDCQRDISLCSTYLDKHEEISTLTTLHPEVPPFT